MFARSESQAMHERHETHIPWQARELWNLHSVTVQVGRPGRLNDDERIVGDCVTNDALQTKIASKKQRRRSFILGPATTKFVELCHVTIDVFGAQIHVFVLQPPFSLLYSLWHFCNSRKLDLWALKIYYVIYYIKLLNYIIYYDMDSVLVVHTCSVLLYHATLCYMGSCKCRRGLSDPWNICFYGSHTFFLYFLTLSCSVFPK